MSDNLKVLSTYFDTGTAEGEVAFLDEAFIPLDDYVDIISIPPFNPRLLIGKKGSGKSAFLRFFKSQMELGGIPVLFLRPKDIQFEANGSNESLGTLTRLAENAIIKAIGVKIGSGIEGLTLREDDAKLFELAKTEGYNEQDTVQKILKILAPIGQAVTKVDFEKIASVAKGIPIKGIKKAIDSSLSKSKQFFYLLIDDTDQVASPDKSDHLNRIWSFLLAARSIMEECENIKCIISLRDEVWKRLKRDEAGQRDQVDHFRNLAYFLNPSDRDIEKIIEKRLLLACNDLGLVASEDVYKVFFDTKHVKIPTAEEQYRYWSDFISKRSRQRPRDGIQLVASLAKRAMQQKNAIIQTGDVEYIMPIYSEERVDDLKRETDSECPEIKEIIRAFDGLNFDIGSFTLSPNATYTFLENLPSRFSIKLFSITLRPNDKDHAFLLWRFLHEIGFLNARVTDTRERHGYRHITADEDPELISVARWNDMQKIAWEIHPAYRDYLIKIQKERSFGFGLPKKPKKSR